MTAPLFFFTGAPSVYETTGTVTTVTSVNTTTVLPSTSILVDDVISGYNVNPSSSISFDISSGQLASGWARIVLAPVPSWVISTTVPLVELVGAGSQSLLRLIGTTADSGSTVSAQYYDGTQWVTFGTPINTSLFLTPTGGSPFPTRLDIFWNIADSGGSFVIYRNQETIFSFTGDTLRTSATFPSKLRISNGLGNGRAIRLSLGAIVDSQDTRTIVVTEDTTNGNGSLTQWSGPSDNTIDWQAVQARIGSCFATASPTLTNFLTAPTKPLTSTFTFDTIPSSLSTWQVEAVYTAHVTKALNDPGFVVTAVAEDSSNNVYQHSQNFQPSATQWQVYQHVWETNPATGLPWASVTAVQNMKFGVRTIP